MDMARVHGAVPGIAWLLQRSQKRGAKLPFELLVPSRKSLMSRISSAASHAGWAGLLHGFVLVGQEAAALVRPELGVDAAALQQLLVRAFFHDMAFVHDDQAIHGGDGG